MRPNFGTPKIINFPFGTNGTFIIFRCPNIEAHYGTTASVSFNFLRIIRRVPYLGPVVQN